MNLSSIIPFIGLIGLIPALALLVYIIMFWVRYSTVCKWLFKWSKGQFTAPKKRYSLLLLHGVGLISSLHFCLLVFY